MIIKNIWISNIHNQVPIISEMNKNQVNSMPIREEWVKTKDLF